MLSKFEVNNLEVSNTGVISTLNINNQYILPTGVGDAGDSLVYAGSNQIIWSGIISHPTINAASDSDNSGRTYIQDIFLDSYGHITGITTATETVVDTNTETLTALSGDSVNTKLIYVDESGTSNDIDLSWAMDDTNLARLTSGTINNDGIATFSRDDGTSFNVDFSVLFDDTNLSRITTGNFDTSNGTLTLTRALDNTTFSINFDGRYLQSGDNVSELLNDVGYVTSGNFPLSGQLVNDIDLNNYNITGTGNITIDGNVTVEYFYGDLDGVVVTECRNDTGSTIAEGTPVYVAGYYSSNGKPLVAPADCANAAKMPAIGLLASELTTGSEGHVHVFGLAQNLPSGVTNGFSVGNTVYVDNGGGLTNVRPTGVSELVQNIGRVLKTGTNGRILVLGPGRSNDVPNSGHFEQLSVDGYTALAVDNGNVGIGTASPDVKLHIEGTAPHLRQENTLASSSISHYLYSDGVNLGGLVGYGTSYAGGSFLGVGASGVGLFSNNGADLAVGTFDGAGNIRLGTNSTERVRIDGFGNVGIGTASPSHKLDVSGVGRFVHADGDCGLIVEDSGGSGVHIGDCAFYGDTYAGIKHSSHTGSEYMLISKGDHTFMSAASGSASIIRGGRNSTSSEIRVNDTVDGGAGVVINNQYADRDVRIHGTGDPYVFYVDASADSVGIGTPSPSEKLDVNGSIRTRTGGIGHEDEGCYIAYPGGGTYNDSSTTQTGYLKITLPVSWTSTMVAFDIDIYEYTTQKIKKFRVGGYNYTPSTQWINTSAMMDSDNDFAKYLVRFGHDGTKCAIYISEKDSNNIDLGSSTTWNYCKVSVSNFFGGWSNFTMVNWADGWDVGFTTTLGTINGGTIEVSRPYRQHDTSYVFNEYGGAYNFRVEGDSDQNLLFVQGSGGADKVGIGTASPTDKLTVEPANDTTDLTAITMRRNSGWGGSYGNKYLSQTWRDSVNTVAAIGARYDGTSVNLDFHSMYNGGYKTSSDVVMSIHGDGKVGIGTASPSYKLDVAGSGHFDNNISVGLDPLTDQFGLEIYKDKPHIIQRLSDPSGAISHGNWYGNDEVRFAAIAHYGPEYSAGTAFNIGPSGSAFASYVADIGIGTLSQDSLIFGTYNTERARINPAGWFGIGTDNPSAKLNVESGNVVFNDLGGNYDFRVEGDSDPNLLVIDASSDKVGIGGYPDHGKLTIDFTHTNDNLKDAIYIENICNSTSNGVYQNAGIDLLARKIVNSGVTDTGQIIGVDAVATLDGDGNLTSAYGARTWGGIYLNQSGTLTNAWGIQPRVFNAGKEGSLISNAKGIDIQIDGDLFDRISSDGITNAKALYIRPIANATNKYGIYQEGSSDDNYFAGDVGIGTASPSYKLDVSGSGSFDALNINDQFTFPTADGSTNQILVTDGSGNISWNDIGDIYSGFSDYEELTTSKQLFAVSGGYTVGSLDVYYNGLKLIDGEDYTATDGTTFRLASAGSINDIVEWEGHRIAPEYATIGNPGDYRLLTSNGSSTTINGESDLVYTPTGLGVGTTTPGYKLDVNGTFSANSINVNDQFTFPNTDGSADQVLVTDGSGVLTWKDQSGGGTGSVAAWGSYNGSTNVRGQEYNISSITDNGNVGNHTVNLNITMSSTDYCVIANEYHRTGNTFGTSVSVSSKTTTSFGLYVGGINGTTPNAYDSIYVAYAVFGT